MKNNKNLSTGFITALRKVESIPIVVDINK
jgi:hypothetical protein